MNLHPYDIYHQDEKPGAHWGDYQYVGHDHEQLGQDPTVPHGAFPDLSQYTGTEVVDGLTFVRSDLRAALIQVLAYSALDQMVVDPNGGMVAKAMPLATGVPNNWISEHVAQGFVIMIDTSLAQLTQANFVFVKTPALVRKYASSTGVPARYGIVDGPQDIINAAKAQPQPLPQPVAPTGPVRPQEGLPSWVLPVGIGATLLLAGGIVYMAKKKRR